MNLLDFLILIPVHIARQNGYDYGLLRGKVKIHI